MGKLIHHDVWGLFASYQIQIHPLNHIGKNGNLMVNHGESLVMDWEISLWFKRLRH